MFNYKHNIKGGKGAILFLLFLLQACAPNTIHNEAPMVNEIKSGEKFTIILPENHTEQSFWRTKETNGKCIEQLNAIWHGNEKGVYFNYLAVKTGVDTIHFSKLKRQDTLENKKFIFQVN
jgi:predicted secreted protein